MKLNELTSWIKLFSSAGLLTFAWSLIQRFININHDRKSNNYKVLLQKIFLPFQKSLEFRLFQFPIKDDIKTLNDYAIILDNFIQTVKSDEKIFYYIDEDLTSYAQKSFENIYKYLTSEKRKSKKYSDAKFNYYKFSEKYWYLLNQTRKFEGVKKRGYSYRLQYHLFSGSKLMFPFNFLEEQINNYILKILVLYLKITVILFILGVFCVIFESS
ncbi:hypothetical protein RyT2_25230 [Pseudolactococcus yaeyamensis]